MNKRISLREFDDDVSFVGNSAELSIPRSRRKRPVCHHPHLPNVVAVSVFALERYIWTGIGAFLNPRIPYTFNCIFNCLQIITFLIPWLANTILRRCRLTLVPVDARCNAGSALFQSSARFGELVTLQDVEPPVHPLL